MTLRTRILSGFGFLLLIFAALAAVVILVQRNQLVDQVDAQLAAATPLGRPPAARPGAAPGAVPGAGDAPAGARPAIPEPPIPEQQVPEEPVSDLWLGVIAPDGTVETMSVGLLLPALPDVSSVDASATTVTTGDLSAADGDVSFRFRAEPREPGDGVLVVATPRTDVDQAVQRLFLSFLLGGLLLVATLGALAVWLFRLGLWPISAVTETARAIRSGDRSQRAPELDPHTEAGELALAFNQMLDDRDEAEDRLRRFVSDASHELRTPLTSVRGYLDLWEQGAFRADGATEDAVRRMQSESGRMATLVDDLLQLARLDEGQPLETSEVAIAQLLEDVAADARAARPTARIAMADVVPPDLRAELDHQRVQQVLAGLVSNALSHNDDPNVWLRATSDETHVELAVVDDGRGMSVEDAARSFDRFHRADGSRARSTGGSGLGLSIAKAVADRHGGTIELVTAPGEGCTFTLRLPRTVSES